MTHSSPEYICMQGSLRKNLFEWQFSVSVIPHHFLRSAQMFGGQGACVAQTAMNLTYSSALCAWVAPLADGPSRHASFCNVVHSGYMNHPKIIGLQSQDPPFDSCTWFWTRTVNCLQCLVTRSNYVHIVCAVVHMPTPAQVLRALFANISVHILSNYNSHSRQEPFLLFGPALILLRCLWSSISNDFRWSVLVEISQCCGFSQLIFENLFCSVPKLNLKLGYIHSSGQN